MQSSQEHLQTKVLSYAKFRGQKKCVMGNSKIGNTFLRNDRQFWAAVLLHQTSKKVRCRGIDGWSRCIQFAYDSAKADRLGNQWLLYCRLHKKGMRHLILLFNRLEAARALIG